MHITGSAHERAETHMPKFTCELCRTTNPVIMQSLPMCDNKLVVVYPREASEALSHFLSV